MVHNSDAWSFLVGIQIPNWNQTPIWVQDWYSDHLSNNGIVLYWNLETFPSVGWSAIQNMIPIIDTFYPLFRPPDK